MKQSISEDLLALADRQLDVWGVSLGEREIEALVLYAEMLASYERANVVGTRNPERLWLDHVLDSLSCLLYEPLKGARSLVDVGSGGGMPGLPLRLAVGFERLCLLESTGKKADFLRYAIEQIGAGGIEVANVRAEELGRDPEHRASFEIATVRAVAPLAVISEYCLPLLEVGGSMVAMKGRLEDEERGAGERAAETLGGELEEVIRVPLTPEVEPKERRLVVVRKTRQTRSRYPRKPGAPKKSPLGISR